MEANIEWKGGMSFETEVEGFKFMLDAHEKVGGQGKGPRPKGLTLASLGGCTGMDVVSILKKMKVEYNTFNIKVSSEISEEHPKKFTKIVVNYIFEGKDLSIPKIKKAINLSQERYCGVIASLKPQVKISSKLIINEEEII